MNILLQADLAALQLTNYGPMGLLAALCISAIVYLEKVRRSRDEDMNKQLQEHNEKTKRLEERFDKYQSEDRARMLEVIQHNTDIMEEVVERLTPKRTH